MNSSAYTESVSVSNASGRDGYSRQTKMVGNRNWTRRAADGKHKPKAKK